MMEEKQASWSGGYLKDTKHPVNSMQWAREVMIMQILVHKGMLSQPGGFLLGQQKYLGKLTVSFHRRGLCGSVCRVKEAKCSDITGCWAEQLVSGANQLRNHLSSLTFIFWERNAWWKYCKINPINRILKIHL